MKCVDPVRLRALPGVLLWASLLSAQAQDPFHQQYTTVEGLPSNQVYCALQDHEGFMWFGTDAGVSRFDGTEFTNFGTADGLTDNEVIGIHEDSAHRIWFLTLNGMFCYWRRGIFHNGDTDEDLRRFRGTSGWQTIAEDRQGYLWFGGVRGELIRLDPGGPRDSVFISIGNTSVMKGADGQLLLLNGLGLFGATGDGWELSTRVSIKTGKGAAIYSPHQEGAWPIAIEGNTVVEITRTGVRSMLPPGCQTDPVMNKHCWRDRHGNIWLNRIDNGIDVIDLTDTGFQQVRRMFTGIPINSVYPAAGGDYWFCTPDRGVLLVSGRNMKGTHVYQPTGSGREAFLTMVADKDRIWLGSDKGSICSFDGSDLAARASGSFKAFRGRILRMQVDPAGALWLAADYGLFRSGPQASGPFQQVPWRGSDKNITRGVQRPAKSVHVGATTVWCGGYGLMRVVTDNAGMYRESVIAGDADQERVYCLYEDAEGRVWSERPDRLTSYEDGVWVSHAVDAELGVSRITDIVGWAPDTLALATTGGGVLLWSGGRTVRQYMPRDGLISSMIRRVRVYGDTLWASSAQGISALVIRSGQVVDHWSWSTADGFPAKDVYDLLVWRGRLHAATTEGLCVSELRPAGSPMETPRLYLSKLAINDSVVTPKRPLILDEGRDRLMVEAHAIEYAMAEQLGYGYQLDGGPDWAACQGGRVLLERLTEGVHRLGIRARIGDGPWSDPLVIPFEVRPVWWASKTMKAAAAFALVSALLFSMYYWSRRDYRRKLAELHAQQVLNEERRRIAADVHDDLGADLSRLLMHARSEGGGMGPDEKMASGLTATIDKIDEIIWSLDPRCDTLQSTVRFIDQLAFETAEAHGIRFRTTVELPEEDRPLAAKTRRELMLIAKEAVRNVVEHARAQELRIEWRMLAGRVTMRIEDDGVGLPPGETSNGRHGLENMRMRAGKLDADLRIGPAEPQGMRVDLSMPLEPHPPFG